MLFTKHATMITTFSILGLGAIVNRVVYVAINHNWRFPHSWKGELIAYFSAIIGNTVSFIIIFAFCSLIFYLL